MSAPELLRDVLPRAIEWIEFSPKEWLVYTIGMTPREKGEFIEAVAQAMTDGDAEFLVVLPFLRRPMAVRYGRVPIPADTRRAVWKRDGGACRECGSTRDLEYDHIVAVVHGGPTTVDNLQLLCRPCNRKKGPHSHERRRIVNG
jgi:hypothetical protein